MNSSTLHLPMENPVPAPLFPTLCVTITRNDPQMGGFAAERWSKEASEKGAARGEICTHQAKMGQGQAQQRAEHKDAWPQPPLGLYSTSRAGPHLRQLPT